MQASLIQRFGSPVALAQSPRIAAPNFSAFAGPIPSIANSSFRFAGRVPANAVRVRSWSNTYAGTPSRLASAARHTRSRAATASPSAVSHTGASAASLDPEPFTCPFFASFFFPEAVFADAAIPFASRVVPSLCRPNSSTTPSLNNNSFAHPDRNARPASVSFTFRYRRTSPSFSYSASSVVTSPACANAPSRLSHSPRLNRPAGSTPRCSVPAAL